MKSAFFKILFMLLCLSFVSPLLAENAITGTIQSPTPFMGNNGEIFKLSDGSYWEVKYEYEYMYEYYPEVVILPQKGKMVINGKTLNVEKVSGSEAGGNNSDRTPDLIESRIAGDFNGFEGETIFQLDNGQIWQQASYAYKYKYKFRPKVVIFKTSGGYEMQVEDVDKRIKVIRLK